jgi:hypothetical protein
MNITPIARCSRGRRIIRTKKFLAPNIEERKKQIEAGSIAY